MESKIISRNQISFVKLIEDKGQAEFVKNKAGHVCAVFADGTICFVSKKASEMMLAGDRDKSHYQYSEIQCQDGSWCPTISPRPVDNILFTIK